MEITFRTEAPIDHAVLSRWTKTYQGRLRFMRSAEGDGVSIELGGEPPLDWLEGFFLGLLGGGRKK